MSKRLEKEMLPLYKLLPAKRRDGPHLDLLRTKRVGGCGPLRKGAQLRGRRNGRGRGPVYLVRQTGCNGGVVEPFQRDQCRSRRWRREGEEGGRGGPPL